MTPEEHAQTRASRITGSRVIKIQTGNYRTWNKLAATMREAEPVLIGQTGSIVAMNHGIETEAQACSVFWEKHPEYDMQDPKWCYWHDQEDKIHWENCGYSPDRLLYQIGKQRFLPLEVKCPFNPDIHTAYRKAGILPTEYVPQLAWGMAVTDSESAWFASFDPRERLEGYGWFEIHVARDYTYEANMMDKVNRFLEGYTMGEEFKPVTPTAKKYQELFG